MTMVFPVLRTSSHRVVVTSGPSPTCKPKSSLSRTAHVVHNVAVTCAITTKPGPVSDAIVSRICGTALMAWISRTYVTISVLIADLAWQLHSTRHIDILRLQASCKISAVGVGRLPRNRQSLPFRQHQSRHCPRKFSSFSSRLCAFFSFGVLAVSFFVDLFASWLLLIIFSNWIQRPHQVERPQLAFLGRSRR